MQLLTHKKNDSENACGYCKQRNSVAAYRTRDIFGDDYGINKCNICSAYFLAPQPSAQQLARAYDESYYGEGGEKFKDGLIEKMLDYFRMKRARMICGHLGNKGKILDIGCGNGKFLSFVKKQGDFEIYGIEKEGGSAKRAAKIPGIHLKTGMLERNDFAAESLDAVTLFQVFEHLTEPQQTVEIITEILKKGGVLAISFPNIGSFQSRVFKGKWLHLDPPRHLFFFDPDDFKKKMSAFGFEMIREKYFSVEYNPFGMQQSLLNCILKKREVLYETLKGNKEYVKEFSKANLLFQNLFFKLSAPLFIISDAVESAFRKGATVEFVMKKK